MYASCGYKNPTGILERALHEKCFRQDKAKIIEEAQFTGVNEYFKIVFNADMAEKTNQV